jgi:hypothetical protein
MHWGSSHSRFFYSVECSLLVARHKRCRTLGAALSPHKCMQVLHLVDPLSYFVGVAELFGFGKPNELSQLP